ncbi:PaaI family thioesterase [Rhodococcus sp. NPDC060090]|uniref:PaaI family thioesterase n=1 Tax=Rhodococcus sp. NPDC060090 TaxID=3347056 RepID=UPI003662C593
MTVSADNTFTSDFGITSLQVSRERAIMGATVTEKLCTPTGTASLGFLTTLVDIVASSPALVVGSPDWTATQDLSIHSAGFLRPGPIAIDAKLIRVGKKTILVETDVYDTHGVTDLREIANSIDTPGAGRLTLAARGLVTFVRLPRSAATLGDVATYTPEEWVGSIREYPITPIDDDVFSRLNLREIDGSHGEFELDLTGFVANSIGTIQGGAQALLAEAAANAMRPELVATDIQIHYLAQVKKGPARSYGTVVRDAADHSVIKVALVDSGADDKLLTLLTITLQRPPR